MQSRRRDRRAFTSLAALAGVALASIGTGASAADAQVRARFGIQFNDSYTNSYTSSYTGTTAPVVIEQHTGFAGTISVNGRVCRIELGDVCGSIVQHFRVSGYHAWHENGKVFVRVGHRRPAIAWTSCDYGVTIRYEGDCLVIDPHLIIVEREVVVHHESRPVHHYSPPVRHYSPPRHSSRPHYTPRHTPRYTPRYSPGYRYDRYRRSPGCW